MKAIDVWLIILGVVVGVTLFCGVCCMSGCSEHRELDQIVQKAEQVTKVKAEHDKAVREATNYGKVCKVPPSLCE
jgi:hypothetical protein